MRSRPFVCGRQLLSAADKFLPDNSLADICLPQTFVCGRVCQSLRQTIVAADNYCLRQTNVCQTIYWQTLSAADICLAESAADTTDIVCRRLFPRRVWQTLSAADFFLAESGRVCGRVWQSLADKVCGRLFGRQNCLRQISAESAGLGRLCQSLAESAADSAASARQIVESAGDNFWQSLQESGRVCRVCGRVWQSLPSLRQTIVCRI